MRSFFAVFASLLRPARCTSFGREEVKRLSRISLNHGRQEDVGKRRVLSFGLARVGRQYGEPFLRGLLLMQYCWCGLDSSILGSMRGCFGRLVVLLVGLGVACAVYPGWAACESPASFVRLYLPPGAPGRNLDLMRDAFYRQYGVQPSFCGQERREYYLLKRDIPMFRADRSFELALRQHYDMQINPGNYLRDARVSDDVVGTYWVLGNINRALLGAGYDLESGRVLEDARLFVRTVDEVVVLGSSKAELILDPEMFRGEFEPPSVVLVDRPKNLVRLPMQPDLPIAEYLSSTAIADPRVQEPSGFLPPTTTEARQRRWLGEYGALSKQELGRRLREANAWSGKPRSIAARPASLRSPKLKCNVLPLPGFYDAAGEFGLAFLARKGYEAPARWVEKLTYPLAWVDAQAQAGWTAVTGLEGNHPLRAIEALEAAALEGLVDDADWVTGGQSSLGTSFVSPYDPYQEHRVVKGLPCPLGG